MIKWLVYQENVIFTNREMPNNNFKIHEAKGDRINWITVSIITLCRYILDSTITIQVRNHLLMLTVYWLWVIQNNMTRSISLMSLQSYCGMKLVLILQRKNKKVQN